MGANNQRISHRLRNQARHPVRLSSRSRTAVLPLPHDANQPHVRRGLWAIALGAALLALLAAWPGQAAARSGQLWTEREQGAAPLASVPNFSALAGKLIPAVVSIQVEQRVRPRQRRGRDPIEDYFFRFFGGEVPREYKNRGLGTGFVISKDGLVLTNYHVVENADRIEVNFAAADGSERKVAAKLLGSAPEYDVALLQTNETNDAAIAFLGNSDSVNIGDWVMAVGNPFGLSHSVSVGIISAKDRREISPSGRRGLYDFLQTDASINPGNSGGPLVNMRGEVIGINTAINAAGSGIGFAIPINMVKSMIPELKETGKFSRSWIGIRIQPLTSELAQSYGLKKAQGALVSEVMPNSPAEEAKLREGDVIMEFDGQPVRNSTDLPLYASMAGVGRKVDLRVWRDGKVRKAEVTLKAFPNEEEMVSEAATEASDGLGLTVTDITPQLRTRFQLETSSGVVIREVQQGSLAAEAGLRPGDVILSLNGDAMTSALRFAKTVRKLKSGAVLRLKVSRQGRRLFLAMRKP